MKKSLIAILALCFSVSYAQSDLFVSSGSFVYVDGNGFTPAPNVAPVYVTNDVNIANNGNIYLRNEGQLLQGNNVGNQGTGDLSVYQEGTVNQWSYNYWCSPVGGVLASTAVNNDFRVNQLDDPLLGTPDLIDSNNSSFTAALNGAASPLLISNRWLFSFVSSDQYSEWIYIGDSGDLAPGLGFTMKGSGTGTAGNTPYDFRGKPNNGNISNPVATGNFTLIGNPYPSAMDSAAFIHDTDNQAAITGTLFYWEQEGSVGSHVLQDYVGGYSEFTINAAGNMITTAPAVFFTYDEEDNVINLPPPGANGTKQAERYIPVGQGFMVEGRAGTTGTVTAKNTHRIFEKEGANSYFFRTTNDTDNSGLPHQDNGLVIVPDDFKRFRLNVDFTVGSNQYTRQMVLNFHDTATMGFDYGLELARSENYASDVYFKLDDKSYSAQAYPFSVSLAIPLVVDIEEQQPLRFRIFDIQNFEDSQEIYIHDIQDDIYVNLRDQDYDLNIEPGNYTNRFEVVFINTTLGINDATTTDLSIRQNNDAQQIHVINPNGLDIKSIEVYDMTGKRLVNGLYESALNRYEISTASFSDGVYIVNITSNNNTVTSEKIIVKR